MESRVINSLVNLTEPMMNIITIHENVCDLSGMTIDSPNIMYNNNNRLQRLTHSTESWFNIRIGDYVIYGNSLYKINRIQLYNDNRVIYFKPQGHTRNISYTLDQTNNVVYKRNGLIDITHYIKADDIKEMIRIHFNKLSLFYFGGHLSITMEPNAIGTVRDAPIILPIIPPYHDFIEQRQQDPHIELLNDIEASNEDVPRIIEDVPEIEIPIQPVRKTPKDHMMTLMSLMDSDMFKHDGDYLNIMNQMKIVYDTI